MQDDLAKMLEGANINLRLLEPEDISLIYDWFNNVEFQGRFTPFMQKSYEEMKKSYSEITEDKKYFIIEKKDKIKIGIIFYFIVKGGPYNLLEIGYMMEISERKKGYCTEAVKLFIDYLFLSTHLERIQATTDKRNIASQKVLEKCGFTNEGTLRKPLFMKGEYVDVALFSILRDDWKSPTILKI
ncbi:MAG: GNAT family N-acetyltransferase [Candidatus Hermodarchaeota archaeon]